MSIAITKMFLLREEMKIHSSDNTEEDISFKSNKTLSLTLDSLKQPIDWFTSAIDEWISRIEINKEMFSTHIIPPRHNTHGGVEKPEQTGTVRRSRLGHF